MESPLKAIGFSALDDSYSLEEILSDVLKDPSKQYAIKLDEKKTLAEYIKKVSEDTYIMARVAVEKQKKSKQPKLDVYDCEPYVRSNQLIDVTDVEIECIDEISAYYVICEEVETNMQLIFWLQNVVEYLEGKKIGKTCKKVNVIGLATEGTIILPIEKDQEEEAFQKEEREKLKAILQKMKEGDEEAKEQLEKEEKELDSQLKERLREEDFLSIMSGYFIPVTLEDAIYAVLGEIQGIAIKTNEQTKEEMYLFALSVNDMPLEVVVNKKDVIGMPSIGMRFMGTCWLQGRVIMDTIS